MQSRSKPTKTQNAILNNPLITAEIYTMHILEPVSFLHILVKQQLHCQTIKL